MSTPGSDLADNIVQEEEPKHIARRRDDFMPWHKVRKQFIRERQWNFETAKLVKRYLKLQTDPTDWSFDAENDDPHDPFDDIPEEIRIERPLNCLVVPGDDLLDVRSLWQSLRPHNCYMRYLGFNEGHGSNQLDTRVHVANNEVTSLDKVMRDSQVLHGPFQAIASENSQAYQYLKKYGPFHVVNLDICDSLFPTTTNDPSDYFGALHRLAEYQMKNQRTPWLLFITTQVEPGSVSAEGLQKLCQPTRSNCDSYPDFATKLGTLVPMEAFQTSDSVIEISALDDESLIRVFGVALGKWLMQLAISANPNWIVVMLTSHSYRIKVDPRVDMLSLAFQFRPKLSPPVDSTGLSNVTVKLPTFPSELESAMKLVHAVEHISDVDELLRANTELHTQMETASADLLEAAGFDREKYFAWLRSGQAD